MEKAWLATQILAVLVLVLAAAHRPLARRWRDVSTRSWQPVKGTLDYAYVGRSGRWHLLSAGYSYRANRKTWSGTYAEEFASEFRAREFCDYLKSVPAAVRYHPAKPGKSVLVPARIPQAHAFRPGRFPLEIDLFGVFETPVFGLYALFGLVFACLHERSRLRLWWRGRDSRHWPLADALIEGGEVAIEPRSFRLIVHYSYQVGARRHTGEYEKLFLTEKDARGLLESLRSLPPVIRYDPAEPSTSVMDPYRDVTREAAVAGQVC